MPKIKRGRRHHYSLGRQKSYERTWQSCSSTSSAITTPVNCNAITTPVNCSDAISSLEQLNISSAISQLPRWHSTQGKDRVELSFFQGSSGIVKYSITINDNFKWSVRVYGRPVPDCNDMFDEFPSTASTAGVIVSICTAIERMNLCEGNNDDVFVNIINGKGGVIRSGDEVSAYYEENDGSIHHGKCILLNKEAGKQESVNFVTTILRL